QASLRKEGAAGRERGHSEVTQKILRLSHGKKGAFVKVPLKLVAPLVAALAIAACNAGGNSTMPGATGQMGAQAAHIPQWQANHTARAACVGSRVGQAQCDVLIATGVQRNGAGLSAANLEDAY